MKLLIKYYSSIFCSLIRAEEIEIKSNKISVSQLKEQISIKFHIPKCDIILTIKYEINSNNINIKTKNNLITLSDDFPLFYFFIHNNTEIFLEKKQQIDKNREIFERIKFTQNKKYRHLKRVHSYSNASISFNSKKNLAIIKESENEYTQIEEEKDEENDINENDTKNKQIIKQAIEFIISDKVTQFNEYIYINQFIQENMAVLTNEENNWNALHYSCFYGREKMTQNLIKLYNPSPELINGITKEGYTPLHLACMKGHINIIKILLFLKDIDVNITSENEGTPLHIACEKNNMQIVSILVSFKANLKIRNSKNKLPIELTTDENIRKILKKAMLYSKDDDPNIFSKDTELSQLVGNFYIPPKPPISIGPVEKRGHFLPIYENIFLEVNPSLGCIKKYKVSKDYPDNYFEKIDLNLISSCTREFPKEKNIYYFSIIFSSKEIYRVKNEKSMERWVKMINESAIFCRYWKTIENKNKGAHEFLNKQKNDIEIIQENGEIKNYEEEQRKRQDEIMQKERENVLKTINSGNIFLRNNPQNINNKNNNSGKNTNNSTNNKRVNKVVRISSKLNIEFINDAGKKGINLDSFELLELVYYYSYGKVYKVKLKENVIEKNPEININSNEILILKSLNKKEINRLKQLKNIETEINLTSYIDSPFVQKIIFSFQDSEFIYVVEEYCTGGNLKWHINLALFEEQEARFYIAELILAIEQMHKKNIVFKNLSSDKILINKDNHIQLMNYGLIQSKIEKKDKKDNIISSLPPIDNSFFGKQDDFISNEISSILDDDKIVDIYGIGVVLYELVCGTKPFYLKENMTLFGEELDKNKLMINDYFSKGLKHLLNKLLSKDKNDKFESLDEVKKHHFFKNIDWIKLANRQIVPQIDLVKNRKDNCNKIGFRKKLKNEKNDYYLDFNIITKDQNFSFVKKNEENKIKNDKTKNEKTNTKDTKNNNSNMSINENYI